MEERLLLDRVDLQPGDVTVWDQEAAAPGALFERLDGKKVRCFACGHRCVVLDGLDGICRVRVNEGGTLFVPRGYVSGLQAAPIEKKPFFHVLPGATTLSFGMLGCDSHCGYCQNWISSQPLRDPGALAAPRDIDAAEIVSLARAQGAPVVVSTYNEPLITSEWAVEIFRLARAEGLRQGAMLSECLCQIHTQLTGVKQRMAQKALLWRCSN